MAVADNQSSAPPSVQAIRNKATIFQWNACSLRPRLSDFRHFVFKHRFPIIAISESRLNTTIRLSGYTVLQSTTGTDLSKVLLAIRKDVNFIQHPIPTDPHNEYVAATLKCMNMQFTVIAAYIPPRANFNIERLQDIMRSTPVPHIITGDFNAHHPAWGGVRSTARGRQLFDFALSNNLLFLNDGQATYYQGARSSALDISMISADLSASTTWSVDIETHGSDHLPTYIEVCGFSLASQRHKVRYTNWEAFADAVEKQDLSNLNYDSFIAAVAHAQTLHTRVLHLPKVYSAVDAEYEKLRAIRRRAERRARKTLSRDDIRTSRRAQKHVQRHLDKLERRKWTSFCAKLDPRKPLSKVWSIVRSLRSQPSQLHPFECVALNANTTCLHVAETFCSKMIAPLAAPSLQNVLPTFVPSPNTSFLDELFTMEELQAALAVTNKRSCPGPDHVSYTSLSRLGRKAKTQLLTIYNNSWIAGSLVESWKTARVIPVLKPGKPSIDLNAYRPIALLSCVGKLMEKMVHSRLTWDLTNRGIYPPSMSGFRKGRSSIDNVIALANCVRRSKAERSLIIAVFLDVKGAFDNVTHEAIHSALRSIGIAGRMYNWLSDYLRDRTIYMSTDQGDTSLHHVSRGVPQGGILSPTLFNISLLGLDRSLPPTVQISLYADDICIWCSGRNRRIVHARLQKAIVGIALFLNKRGLVISPEKCAAISFSRRDLSRYVLKVAGTPIPYVNHQKFLGVTFDRSLSWSPHVQQLKTKLSSYVSIFRMLSTTRRGCSTDSLLRLYGALCEGLLRYSLPVLQGLSQSSIKLLEAMQAKALRVCLGLPKNTSTVGTLAESRRLSVTVLIPQELLRAQLRFAREPTHPFSEQSMTSLSNLLPAQYQRAVPSSFPPWRFASWQISTTIPGIKRKAHTPGPALKYFALEHICARYSHHCHIYTDGSVTAISSSIGVWIPSMHTTISATLSHRTSAVATELTALREAIIYILQQRPAAWVIFSDCRAALQLLKSSRIQEELVIDINKLHTEAYDLSHSIVLQWLPAHCGIAGNDLADAAAKELKDSTRTISIPFSRRDAARLVATESWRLQRSLWCDPNHQYRPLHRIDPTCVFRIPHNLNRWHRNCLHRIRLNVSYTNYFLHKIGIASRPLCSTCDVCENFEHLVTSCQRFTAHRRTLRNNLSLPKETTLRLEHVLGPWCDGSSAARATKALLTFLKDTGLINTL